MVNDDRQSPGSIDKDELIRMGDRMIVIILGIAVMMSIALLIVLRPGIVRFERMTVNNELSLRCDMNVQKTVA